MTRAGALTVILIAGCMMRDFEAGHELPREPAPTMAPPDPWGVVQWSCLSRWTSKATWAQYLKDRASKACFCGVPEPSLKTDVRLVLAPRDDINEANRAWWRLWRLDATAGQKTVVQGPICAPVTP